MEKKWRKMANAILFGTAAKEEIPLEQVCPPIGEARTGKRPGESHPTVMESPIQNESSPGRRDRFLPRNCQFLSNYLILRQVVWSFVNVISMKKTLIKNSSYKFGICKNIEESINWTRLVGASGFSILKKLKIYARYLWPGVTDVHTCIRDGASRHGHDRLQRFFETAVVWCRPNPVSDVRLLKFSEIYRTSSELTAIAVPAIRYS